AHATVDTVSEPEEALSEIEEFLPLVSRVPLTDEEFEASEPLDTSITSSHSTTSSDSTTPLFPDHPLTQTAPTPMLSRPLYYHRTARIARYRSSYETLSSSASPAPSSTLPLWKRYQATFKLILDIEIEDEEPLGLRYGATRRRALELAEEIEPSIFEVGQSSRSVPDQQVTDI
ncbi:hypothetical protein Tco_0915612, partial [Tanacetum coccineum]